MLLPKPLVIPFFGMLLFAFGVESCNHSQGNKVPVNKQPVLALIDHNAKEPACYKDANWLIASLENDGPLEAEHIGFEGRASTTYPFYKHLCLVAVDTTFLRLTYLANPKMRVYGMWGLIEKNKKLALQRMRELKNDQTTIEYISGCTTLPEPVNALMASHFDSTEVSIKWREARGVFLFQFDVLVR